MKFKAVIFLFGIFLSNGYLQAYAQHVGNQLSNFGLTNCIYEKKDQDADSFNKTINELDVKIEKVKTNSSTSPLSYKFTFNSNEFNKTYFVPLHEVKVNLDKNGERSIHVDFKDNQRNSLELETIVTKTRLKLKILLTENFKLKELELIDTAKSADLMLHVFAYNKEWSLETIYCQNL